MRLKTEPDRVCIEVRDFGRGLAVSGVPAAMQATGVGLAGMRERLRQLGGKLTIESDSTGTSIVASVPFTSPVVA